MQPVSPVISEEYKDKEVVYAENQKEYNPLPFVRREDGVILTRWKPTDSEREAIAAGSDIYLSIWTFNQPLQPLYMETVECDADAIRIAERMGLLSPIT